MSAPVTPAVPNPNGVLVRNSSARRRFGLIVGRVLTACFAGVIGDQRILNHMHQYPRLPFIRRLTAPFPSWDSHHPAVRVPAELLTQPGIQTDPQEVDDAFRKQPLQMFFAKYPKVVAQQYKALWMQFLVVGPYYFRYHRSTVLAAQKKASHQPVATEPNQLTAVVRQKAKSIGLSAIGIAKFDPRYTWGTDEEREQLAALGDRIIVCVGELPWTTGQLQPSVRASVGDMMSSGKVGGMTGELALALTELGYRAKTDITGGVRGMSLKYAVEAGLGQLGRQGLLLTPIAGPRVKMNLIQTNAPLAFDTPVDYGVTKLCDSCMVCVRNCPANAIPLKRTVHRGVYKAKINTDRCLPTIFQGDECSVCVKVCPVQRYGLQPVLDEFALTGRVLGKDTDELEGYDWVDGKHYGPNARPKLPDSWFEGAQWKPRDPSEIETRPAGAEIGHAPLDIYRDEKPLL